MPLTTSPTTRLPLRDRSPDSSAASRADVAWLQTAPMPPLIASTAAATCASASLCSRVCPATSLLLPASCSVAASSASALSRICRTIVASWACIAAIAAITLPGCVALIAQPRSPAAT